MGPAMGDAAEALHGVARGKVIELERDPGLPDGAAVVVQIRRAPAAGEGTRRSADAWAADVDDLEAFLSEMERRWYAERRSRPVATGEDAMREHHASVTRAEQRRAETERFMRLLHQANEGSEEASHQLVWLLVKDEFARYLRRRLTPSEQDVLQQRFTTLGPDRLGDVVIDLDATALAAWLADPAAH